MTLQVRIGNLLFCNFQSADEKRTVTCTVKRFGAAEDESSAEKTKSTAETVLRDLGRWEQLVKSISDLGFGKEVNSVRSFGYELYDIDVGTKRTDHKAKERSLPSKLEVHVDFTLTRLEALRRTKGVDDQDDLEVDEIYTQIGNIPKWLNITTVMKALLQS